MTLRTPGVYIVEKSAFPNSVVEVATAVPVFIGYTQMAVNEGRSLKGVPWRISSMSEYIRCFGVEPRAQFTIEGPSAENDAANADKDKGKNNDRPASKTEAAAPSPVAPRGQESVFTWNKKQYKIKRAAAEGGGRYLMYLAMQHFFANGGAACYIVSVGDFHQAITAADLIVGLEPLLKEQEPTMVVVPDAVLLDQAGCLKVQQEVLLHCGHKMRNRVAILDVWGGDRDRKDTLFAYNCIDEFRNGIGSNQLDFAAAYFPWLQTSLVQPDDLDFSAFGTDAKLAGLRDLLKADLGITVASTAINDPRLKQRAEALDDMVMTEQQWVDKLKVGIAADDEKDDAAQAAATREIDDLVADPEKKKALVASHRALLQKSLVAMSDLYACILKEACGQVSLIPPSAAMAGLYTMVDNSRGVWKAPANISVNAVVKPAVEISQDDQEDLNVTIQGKSINAIRSFIGEGALVWGARTLDGNSLDWRYISVRRTAIMLEQSCRLAAKAMVFEPNVGNTWVTIKSMLSNFLTGIWKRGGLAGETLDDAFSVHLGLGETMTPEDVLEGILRITVLVAISRPAEFIEITFQQQMQKS